MSDWKYTSDMKVRYRIRDTGHGSDRFGVCQICGKRCDTVHAMTVERRFLLDMIYWYTVRHTWQQTWGWTPDGCALNGTYGHLGCLEGIAERA